MTFSSPYHGLIIPEKIPCVKHKMPASSSCIFLWPAATCGIVLAIKTMTIGISEVWLRNGVEIKDAIVFGDMVFEPGSGGIGLISDRAVDRFFDSIRMSLMRRPKGRNTKAA